MRKLITNKKGFTLIELVAVSALLGMLMLIVWGSLRGIIRSREIVENKSSALRTARNVLDRMNIELTSANKIPLGNRRNFKPANGLTNNLFLEGENKKKGENETDIIRFVSLSGGLQSGNSSNTNFGPVEVWYYLVKEKDEEEGNFSKKSSSYKLMRAEFPAGYEDLKYRESKKVIYPIAENIHSFNLRYLEKQFANSQGTSPDWKDSWDKLNSLPKLIEIELTILGPKEDPKNTTTIKSSALLPF